MELPCIIEHIVFQKEDGFAILAVNLNANSSKYNQQLEDVVQNNCEFNKYGNFTATVGMFYLQPEVAQGHQFIFVGDFISHKKFGKQFKAEFFYDDIPETEDGFRDFLMVLPNIKESRSLAIIKRFGVKETVRILDEEPSKLTEISGITERMIPLIKKIWTEKKVKRDLYEFLSKHKIQLGIADKIYNEFGDDSLTIIQENPYAMCQIKGIGFIQVDEMAHMILSSVPKGHRVKACLQYILRADVHKNSNLCMSWTTLKTIALDLINKCNRKNNSFEDIREYENLIPAAIKSNLDIFAAVKNVDQNSMAFVYLRDVWEKEKYIAECLYSRKNFDQKKATFPTLSEYDMEETQIDVSKFTGRPIELDECQKDAIRSVFEHKITVITGGGGTGKSTICRCIFHLAMKNNLSIRMMSPTGKAAQVLAEKTNCGAATIHKSLKLKPGQDIPKDFITEDILLIDEVSMVGVDTMYAIMLALRDDVWNHIVFVGDPNQLPSVSPGSFLTDIIASGCANVIKLDKVHRQDENSYIALLANEVAHGHVVDIPKDANDIFWHSIRSTENFPAEIKEIIKKYLDDHNDINDLQFMAPMYKGDCGVNNINETIQDVMSDIHCTKDKHLKRGFMTFYLKDRVIQTRNNYDKCIFNGDMGFIVDIGRKVIDPAVNDREQDFLVVNFYGDKIMYVGDEEISELKPAWCITVHKFQGSQCRNIIFILVDAAAVMASKELLYTAMTRAEKKLDIYGHMSMFKLSPTKSVIRERYTNLVNIIKGLRENRQVLLELT